MRATIALLAVIIWSSSLAAQERSASWTVGCYQDRLTLRWTCFATKFFGSSNPIRVQYSEVTGYCFSGPQNNHPGRSAVIRIGENEPIYYGSSLTCGRTAELIIDQLMTEQNGAARGSVWPSRTHEFEFDASGFPAAFAALAERIENPRPGREQIPLPVRR